MSWDEHRPLSRTTGVRFRKGQLAPAHPIARPLDGSLLRVRYHVLQGGVNRHRAHGGHGGVREMRRPLNIEAPRHVGDHARLGDDALAAAIKGGGCRQ